MVKTRWTTEIDHSISLSTWKESRLHHRSGWDTQVGGVVELEWPTLSLLFELFEEQWSIVGYRDRHTGRRNQWIAGYQRSHLGSGSCWIHDFDGSGFTDRSRIPTNDAVSERAATLLRCWGVIFKADNLCITYLPFLLSVSLSQVHPQNNFTVN